MDNTNSFLPMERPAPFPVFGEMGQRLTDPLDSCPHFICSLCGASADIDMEHNCPVFMERVPCQCRLCTYFRGEFGCLNPAMRAN